MLLDRSFELALKAAIVNRGGQIRESCSKETIGIESCINKCTSDAQLKCLTEAEACTIRIINGHRDAAQHYFLEISEHQLYIFTQAGLTLFNNILFGVFGTKIDDYLPERILPVSSNPPRDFVGLMDIEFARIRDLIFPGSRRQLQVHARLRSFAIIENSILGDPAQPSEIELHTIMDRVGQGEEWANIFPGVSQLRLCNEGNGINVTLKISKSEGEPVCLVPQGTSGAHVTAVKRVNELDYYTLNLTALAKKTGLNRPKMLAVVKHLRLREDSDYFKEFTIDSCHFKRYSAKALDKVKKELPNLNIDEIWEKHKPSGRKALP